MKIKIFSDRSLFPEDINSVPMMYPFWGTDDLTYQKYINEANSLFEMSDLENADFAIMPFDWLDIKNHNAEDIALKFAKRVKEAQKKLIVFSMFDAYQAIPFDNCIVFHSSFHNSTKTENELALPTWHEDLVENYFENKLPIREKLPKPTIGFCGLAHQEPNIFAKSKDILLQYLVFKVLRKKRLIHGHEIRKKALCLLEKDIKISTNFIVRDEFFGGAISPNGQVDSNKMSQIRWDYVNTMAKSDYILCVRGNGNYSIRLYETLCCGKIPVFINTDCVLPYEFAIDWKKYCVWVEEDEIPQIAKKVAEFHQQISPQDFIDLQYECRRLWKEWLSPEGFFGNFYRHFL
jgi:hypothetical protein